MLFSLYYLYEWNRTIKEITFLFLYSTFECNSSIFPFSKEEARYLIERAILDWIA